MQLVISTLVSLCELTDRIKVNVQVKSKLRANYGTEDQKTFVCLDSNHLYCQKNSGPSCLLLVGLAAGCKSIRQVDESLVV